MGGGTEGRREWVEGLGKGRKTRKERGGVETEDKGLSVKEELIEEERRE